MIEPPSNPPPPPELDRESGAEPFEPGPDRLSGCSKPAVIGCLVALALLAVGLILVISQSPKLMRFAIRSLQTEINAALPPELEEAERQRLDAAFDGAIAALMAGRIDSNSMGNLQRLAQSVPARGETLDRAEVAEIVRLLEEIAAVPAATGWRAGGRRPLPA